MDDTDARIAALIEKYGAPKHGPLPPPLLECGALDWKTRLTEELEEGKVYCYGGAHVTAPSRRGHGMVVGRCPLVIAGEVRERLAEERKRLGGAIGTLELAGGGLGWQFFDPNRYPGANAALHTVRAFAAKPRGRVLLRGDKGTGKTLLMLAGHFDCLERGVDSRFVTSPDLRRALQLASNYDEDTAIKGERMLHALRGAAVIWFDDLGEIEHDERRRGDFASGLKDLLDGSTAAWCVSTNCSAAEAELHPDVGGKVVDRLLHGALIVPMLGKSARASSSQRVRG